MSRVNFLSIVCCAVLATTSAFAQEVEVPNTVESAKADTAVTLSEDGKLIGNVFATVDGEKQPVEAKITVANKEGVVLQTVESTEEGSFAFPSLEPGTYQMYGSSDSYFGGQSVEVMPYSGGGCATCDLGLNAGAQYDTYASAPASSCGGCGGGGGGFGGGGRLLGGRRFLKLAAIGGIVALAVGDSSPDN